MYIHMDYRNFTKRRGKFINEYVKFDNNWDKDYKYKGA